ncbi:MAG: hypothetical protein WA962_08835 [Ornithinimicrobium sp.]
MKEHHDDAFEAAGATEHLGEIALQEHDLVEAELQFRSLLTKWPNLAGTSCTAEVSLADALSQRDSDDAHDEALGLLERFLDRDAGVRWSNTMFQWQQVRVRLAQHEGDDETAALHAADALTLAGSGPQVFRHQDVGLVDADDAVLEALRLVAGSSQGTGAPYGRASILEPETPDYEQLALEDLAAIGLHCSAVYELDPKDPAYDAACSILLRHLQNEDLPDSFRSELAAALGTTMAAPLWDDLVAVHHTLEPHSLTRDALASALSDVATKDQLADVVRIINDPQWGEDRVYFLRTLTRLRYPERWNLIDSLTEDEDLGVEATHMMLSKRRRDQQLKSRADPRVR